MSNFNLNTIFPNSKLESFEKTTCKQKWNIVSHTSTINYVRRWLSGEIYSMAIDFIEMEVNTTNVCIEVLNQRLSQIPIIADPELFEESVDSDRNERNSLLFELNVENTTRKMIPVTTNQLNWIPLGNQAHKMCPRPMEDILIVKLYPGQAVHIRGYAVKGQGKVHSKWASVNAYHRQLSERTAGKWSQDSEFELTIEVIGGLTFDQIQKQMDRLKIPDNIRVSEYLK